MPSTPVLLRVSKIIGFLLGALCAAFAATALFLLITWDGVQLQAQITREIRERLQRPLAMEHPPRLLFLPSPTVVIDGLALGSRTGVGIPVKAARIEASLALAPLLRGNFEVNRLRVLDPELSLQRQPDGTLDLADLLDLGDTTVRPWPIAWRLNGLAIERGRLEYRDANKATALRFERISVNTGPLSAGSHGRISGSASLTHGPGDASGGAELDMGYHLGAQRYDIDFASLRFRGEALGVTGLDAMLNARNGQSEQGGAFCLKRLVLRGHGRLGTNTLEVKAEAKALASQNQALALQGLDALLKLDDGERHSEIELELPALAPRASKQPGDVFKAMIKTRSEHSRGEGSLVGKAAFRSASGRIELAGLGLHWRNFGRKDSPVWSAQLGGSLAFAPFFQRGEAQLQASLDAARLKFSGSFDADRSPPWNFGLSGDRVDMDRIASRFGKSGPTDLLAAIAGTNSHGRVDINNLALAGLHANQFGAKVSVADGVLQFDELKALLYGGTLEGSLRYQAASSHLALDQKFDAINLAALAADLHRTFPVRGELSGFWQLETPLGSQGKSFKALSGKTRFALHKTVWQGMDLENFLRAVRPSLKNRGKAERGAQMRERQELDALAMDCQLSHGIAGCNNFSGVAPWLRLGGGGSLALGEGKLDWLLRMAIQSRGKIPRDLLGLRGLMVPVRVNGPLMRPQWRLEWEPRPVVPPVAKTAPRRKPNPEVASASAAG